MRSLRVLFLATRDWYNPATTGGDNTLWENARYLASVGHEVTYVAAGFPGASKQATIDGINVVRLGGIHSLWLRSFAYYMARGRGRYDVVVTEGFGGSRIPRLAPLYVKEPIITAWHQVHQDLFAAQYPQLLAGALSTFERGVAWIHRNTKVQAYTSDWKREFPRIGFRAENVFVVPVSIPDDWLAASHRNDVAEPNVLWIGKLRRYKCPHHVILAMPEIVQSIPAATLTVAGRRDDSRYQNYLRKLVAELGLDRAVRFQFDMTEGEKKDLLRRSRLLVLPSAVEGFGIVTLEANAYGIPVVASSRVPEGAVREGVNGLRYPFGDVKRLGALVVSLLTDESLYARLAEGALSTVKEYRWSNVGPQFERQIANLVTEPSG